MTPAPQKASGKQIPARKGSWDGRGPVEIRTRANSDEALRGFLLAPEIGATTSFQVDFRIDPVTGNDGNGQVVAGVSLELSEADTNPATRLDAPVRFEFREADGNGMWTTWLAGSNATVNVPKNKAPGYVDNGHYQWPHYFTPHPGPYAVRLVGLPEKKGTRLKVYFEHLDRPVEEHFIPAEVPAGRVGFFVIHGGQETQTNTARFHAATLQAPAPPESHREMTPWQAVLGALDPEHPAMRTVLQALNRGQTGEARRGLLEHFRTRQEPKGPSFQTSTLHPDYAKIADAALRGHYGNLQGYFQGFAPQWTDAKGQVHSFTLADGTLNWPRDPGHLNRHFHWLSLAKAYQETGQASYMERLGFEVEDWVTREPFFWPRCPGIGGLNLMDGTRFVRGWMNTSNIGRRCELTWGPAYEVARRSGAFSEDAHFAMLLGFLRQARLLMNPTSFAVHDDGGSHGAVALLQTALLLPEFREAAAWKREALRRWEEILKVQFYPDGSHVSLSTGYNWGSILSLENVIRLFGDSGVNAPVRFRDALERAYEHPLAISRPNQGQIDLNDGGWGMTDDHYQRATHHFPNRKDFAWMASKGVEGSPPAYTSRYFPNAGQFILRTGWGPGHRYLFFDAGPVGASHGRDDKLNLYVDWAGHQLISSGGRGTYDGNDYSRYAGSTRSYNTVLVDDGLQGRIGNRQEIYGHTPEVRRWVTNNHLDDAEGFYSSGWFSAKNRTNGRHTRQILFLKGSHPPETGYWLVIDTLEPADQAPHHYKALFHIRRNHAGLAEESTKTFHGWTPRPPSGSSRYWPMDYPCGTCWVRRIPIYRAGTWWGLTTSPCTPPPTNGRRPGPRRGPGC